ncbi:conjugal transfer protein [Salmonella enterica subsp. enterica serovar Newport]|nr:conjugal transfer protein [Salmonella enterica subsp. enterica serovar Bredeney]EEM9512992.1 conjugal transfer protein [Salmonella enterica]EJQ8147201.1 conjugal transfer protein [Salmonella enterica subsp. enterica serovar Newport]EBY2600035.1 conjugal transfer protein [Salmonella enterica subsp. enterica serovar Bredeney]EJW0496373.1 conjugal transfer protein [Salmonella enterica subsp. enterica serovar Newport]
MKRDGFWRYATPPVNLWGIPLPFTMIYLFIFPFPSKTTFWICTGILLFFIVLDRSGWSLRALCSRLFSALRGTVASGRPWWYRHFIESPRDRTGL